MMDTPPKADPAIYLKLRENSLRNIRLNNLTEESVHSVLMDWRINIGIITVLAAADGTASIYLSNGGGYLGGGQKFPKIRQLAIYSCSIRYKFVFPFPADGDDRSANGRRCPFLLDDEERHPSGCRKGSRLGF